jgi:hypothetical protein
MPANARITRSNAKRTIIQIDDGMGIPGYFIVGIFFFGLPIGILAIGLYSLIAQSLPQEESATFLG